MINSKLSKKSFKKRSLKLKNKRTKKSKKSKVSKKNVRKMKGGLITNIDDAKKRLEELTDLDEKSLVSFDYFIVNGKSLDYLINILNLKTNIEDDFNLTEENLTLEILQQKYGILSAFYDPNNYRGINDKELSLIMDICFKRITKAYYEILIRIYKQKNEMKLELEMRHKIPDIVREIHKNTALYNYYFQNKPFYNPLYDPSYRLDPPNKLKLKEKINTQRSRERSPKFDDYFTTIENIIEMKLIFLKRIMVQLIQKMINDEIEKQKNEFYFYSTSLKEANDFFFKNLELGQKLSDETQKIVSQIMEENNSPKEYYHNIEDYFFKKFDIYLKEIINFLIKTRSNRQEINSFFERMLLDLKGAEAALKLSKKKTPHPVMPSSSPVTASSSPETTSSSPETTSSYVANTWTKLFAKTIVPQRTSTWYNEEKPVLT